MMNPWFAVAGLIAISIPVWMHLYQRVASRRVKISSLRLVPETPRIALSRRRIKHWPLLLLRALGVVLLGLAFAKPGLINPTEDPQGGREAVVFILDRSGSMAMRDAQGTTAWEDAVQQVQTRLKSMHPQSRVRLFCFPATEIGDDWVSPSALRKTVKDLSPTLSEGRPIDALHQATEALARFRSDMPESIEVVSDLQQHGWDEIDTLTLPEEIRVKIRQAGVPDGSNNALSLQVRGRDQLRRGAVVTDGGTAPITVRDQGIDSVEESKQEFVLPDRVLEIPYRSETTGWVRRKANFTQDADGLPEDDHLFDTFYVAPDIPVFLLEPHPQRDTFVQTTFFLHQALRPTTGDAAIESRFIPRVLPLGEAAEMLDKLEVHDAVVVVPALATWPGDLPATLETFARKGGGVVFFAGPDIQPDRYAHTWQQLLPASLGEATEIQRTLTLAPIDDTHPIWGGFDESLRRTLRKAPLKSRFALSITEDTEVIARYADGVPLVSRRPIGEGYTLFVNTSADRAWSDWPTEGATFVPTVHMLMSAVLDKTMQWLRNSPGVGIVDVPFDVRVDPGLSGVKVRAAGRPYTVDEQGWVRGLRFDRPGLFDITSSQDDEMIRPVAVNFPPAESKRDVVRPTILQRQLEAKRRTTAGADGPLRISMSSESLWWRWIVIGLAGLLLVEAWVAMGPQRTETASKAEPSDE